MMKLIEIKTEDIPKLTQLSENNAGKCLLEVLKEANNKINKGLRAPVEGAHLHRLQGAGQAIDEVIGVIENAREWFDNIQKRER
jgi:hypothetical protein